MTTRAAVGAAARVGRQVGSAASVVQPERRAGPLPLPVVAHRHHDRPVAGLEGLVDRDDRVGASARTRLRVAREVAGDPGRHEGQIGLEERDVDDLAYPGRLLPHERGGDRERGDRAGGDVRQRRADPLRHAVVAGHAHHSRTGLRDEVVAGQRRVGAGEPEARQGTDHQVREPLSQALQAQTVLLQLRGVEVLDEHVGRLQQLGRAPPGPRPRGCRDRGSLVAVHREEPGRLAVEEGRSPDRGRRRRAPARP